MGVNVTCVDIDTEKIARLKAGEIPIYEPGLSDLVGRNSAAGRLHFATSLTEVLGQVEIVFCAVGHTLRRRRLGRPSATCYPWPWRSEFSARPWSGKTLLVTKSTVPVGTSAKK